MVGRNQKQSQKHPSHKVSSGAFAKVRKATISFVMSVCLSVCLSIRPSARNNSVPTGRTLIKFDIYAFFETLSRKFKFHYNPTGITGTLHNDVFTFMTIYRQILLRMRTVSSKSCRENQNTQFIFHNVLPKIVPFYEITSEKCGGARGAADNTAHAHCMLDK
jgi:hypothetical protein